MHGAYWIISHNLYPQTKWSNEHALVHPQAISFAAELHFSGGYEYANDDALDPIGLRDHLT